MIQPSIHMTLHGESIHLALLDEEERAVFDEISELFAGNPSWNEFDNAWTRRIIDLYDARGIPRSEAVRKPLIKIAQDLSGRIAIEQGLARMPDYRDELEAIIRERFKTRPEFCQVTGISEDMLSHVLARRKHLAIDTLTAALEKIGCALRIVAVRDPE